jgi:hypothetical protein
MAGMSSREQTRRHMIAACVEAVASATLSDLLAFLTPVRIAAHLEREASITTIRRLRRSEVPEMGLMSAPLGRMMAQGAREGFVSSGAPLDTDRPSWSSHLGSPLGEHFEHVWLHPAQSYAHENFALIALATCHADFEARDLLKQIEQTQRNWLAPLLRAAGADHHLTGQLVNALSMIRYGQILAVRRSDPKSGYRAIRAASLILSGLMLEELDRPDLIDNVRLGYPVRANSARSSQSVVITAAFDALASARFDDLFSWLTPSRICASAAVDRKTVAHHFSHASRPGRFDRRVLMEAIERAVFEQQARPPLDTEVLVRALGCLHYAGAATRHSSWLDRPGMSTKETVFADLEVMQRTTTESLAETAAYMIHIACAGHDAASWRTASPPNDNVRDGLIPVILEAMSVPIGERPTGAGGPGDGATSPSRS